MGETLIEALEDQLGCYRRLAKLAEIQHVHVQQNQTESLLEVLKSRQTVLEQISVLEQVIAPVKRNWLEYIGKTEMTVRVKTEKLLTETRRLLEQITMSDQNDAMVLQQRKLNLGREIHQTSSAGRVNRTYAAAAYGSPQSRMDMQR